MSSETPNLLCLVGWVDGRMDSSAGELTLGSSIAHGGLSPQGTEIQSDYMPLLNSLAAYGWQLTCVLPTPILKTTRYVVPTYKNGGYHNCCHCF